MEVDLDLATGFRPIAGSMSSNDPITADRNKERLRAALPAAETKRWSCRRKAAVVVAVRAGVLGRQEACERYLLSPEELAAWETGSARTERHSGAARHASADLPRLSAQKSAQQKAVRIPCRTGNCREEIALQPRSKPENRFISDINDPARAPAGGSGREALTNS
jgi:hypothetical protein